MLTNRSIYTYFTFMFINIFRQNLFNKRSIIEQTILIIETCAYHIINIIIVFRCTIFKTRIDFFLIAL